MSIERAVLLMAGVMVFATTALAMLFPNGYWQWFTLFIGFNMVQSVFSGFCPAVIIFKKVFGLKSEAELCQIKSAD